VERTSSSGTTLYWTANKGVQHSKTITHSDQSSVPMFLTKLTIKPYREFRQKNNNDENKLSVNISAHYYTDTEQVQVYTTSDPQPVEQPDDTQNTDIQSQTDQANEGGPATTETSLTITVPAENIEKKLSDKPIMIDFHDNKTSDSKETEEKDEFQHLDGKSLKLLWHYRLQHMPFSTIN
jgi:hypothetical protein